MDTKNLTEQDIRNLINSTTQELNALGYNPKPIKEIKFVYAQSFYAMVYVGEGLLKFSKYFFGAPIEQIEATIMHEMIHMVCPSWIGHGSMWKEVAKMVSKAYPKYNIKRTGSNSAIVTENWSLRKQAALRGVKGRVARPKIQVKCPNCGQIYNVPKGGKCDTHLNLYHCRICNCKHLIHI